MSKPTPILLGIIIDVSSSMQRSWNVDARRNIPKIEVIRDGLNQEFGRISQLYSKKFRSTVPIDVFCLGMGFILRQKLVSVDLKNGFEVVKPGSEHSVRTDTVCDIITLTKLIPDKSLIEKLGDRLKLKWQNYAEDIIAIATIKEDVYGKLQEYIEQSFYTSSNERFLSSWYFRLFEFLSKHSKKHKYIENLHFKYKGIIEKRREIIKNVSKNESARYFGSLKTKSAEIFDSKKSEYKDFITKEISNFADWQIQVVLESLSLGYSFEDALKGFDTASTFSLAKAIYSHLDKDVQKNIGVAWQINKTQFALAKKSIDAAIEEKEVRRLSELCVQKYGWQILRPFVEEIVFSVFTERLKSQIDGLTQYWLDIATYHNQTISIKDLTKILPSAYGNNVYSEKFMFGTTPIIKALDKASLRLLDKNFKNRKKVLILISDGEFDEEHTFFAKVNMLKQQGIFVICGYVGGTASKVTNSKQLAKGGNLMRNVASSVNDDTYWLTRADEWGVEFLDEGRLFIHLNQEETLHDLVDYLVGLAT